jgi:hypothetical protein
MFYQICSFDRSAGTYVVQFFDPDHPPEVERRTELFNGVFLERPFMKEIPALNYPAPRSNGVYLSGQALEDAVKLLIKPSSELTETELQIIKPTDDPALVTGGEDIDAKVALKKFTKI